jgi:hypothetical protein
MLPALECSSIKHNRALVMNTKAGPQLLPFAIREPRLGHEPPIIDGIRHIKDLRIRYADRLVKPPIRRTDRKDAIEPAIVSPDHQPSQPALQRRSPKPKVRLTAKKGRYARHLARSRRDQHGRGRVAVHNEGIKAAAGHLLPELRRYYREKAAQLVAPLGAVNKTSVVACEQIDIPSNNAPEPVINCTSDREVREIQRRYRKILVPVEVCVERSEILYRVGVNENYAYG